MSISVKLSDGSDAAVHYQKIITNLSKMIGYLITVDGELIGTAYNLGRKRGWAAVTKTPCKYSPLYGLKTRADCVQFLLVHAGFKERDELRL